MDFNQLDLHRNVLKGIEDAGFTRLMPVQEETFRHSLKGRDVSVQSQTGTGKTAAFLITIFQHFQTPETAKNKKALIVTPTRELAIQIENDAKLLGGHLSLTIGSFYGGVGYHHQEKLIKKGVDIIIGTPGRLLDFTYQKKLNFKNIGFLVIDEADRMFDMGFLPDIRKIFRNASPRSERQTMLFSATLGIETRQLASQFMNQPVSIQIHPEEVTVKNVSQIMYHVNSREKINLILGILQKEAPNNALIFTNMKRDTEKVARQLEKNGFNCMHISGDLNQKKRLAVLEKFKSGQIPFLVATDVAARGLHIDDLELIINYDLPGDCENYVHRIGRTARAGKSGKAITLACEKYIYNLEAIESFMNMKIPVDFADDGMFLKNRAKDIRFRERTRKDRSSRSHSGKRTSGPGKERDHGRRRSSKGRYDPNKPRQPGKKPNGKETKRYKDKLKNMTLDERLALYGRKYGESFKDRNRNSGFKGTSGPEHR